MDYQDGTSFQKWGTIGDTHYTHHTQGRKYMQAWWIFPQQLIIPGLSTTEQDSNAAKEVIQIMNNTVPKTPPQPERTNYTPLIY